MLGRVLAIAMNTYREAVRARVLYGLLGIALATAAYAVVVASLSLHQEARVVADLGSASISLYAVLVAIVLGATSLHRELELKTVFPILTRRLRRHEYVVGKYFGTIATLAVFVALDAATVLGILALETSQKWQLVLGTLGVFAALLVAGLVHGKYTRVFVIVPWSFALFGAMYLLSGTAGAERQLVVASCALTLCEVAIIAAIATFFSSFSSPFLTALLTLGLFIAGRAADTMGNLPSRLFGSLVHAVFAFVARIVPNLQIYVPPRPLLLGQLSDAPVWPFVGFAAAHALFYATALITVSAIIFRKRDFQ
jgi:Cu-processing system permease protein